MAGIAGKSTLVKASTTAGGAGTYTTIQGIKSASMNIQGQNLDITEMAATTVARIQGLKDNKFSLSGLYIAGDTTGQTAIQGALLNDGELWIQFLPNGTAGFKQQVRVASFNPNAEVAGVVGWSCELEGTGTISTV